MTNILLIGASSKLKTQKIGTEIDNANITARFNYSGTKHIVTENNKEIIGSKTDYWFCLTPPRLVFKDLEWAKKYKKVFINGIESLSYGSWKSKNRTHPIFRMINTIDKFKKLLRLTKTTSYSAFNITKNAKHKNIYILPSMWGNKCKAEIKHIFPAFPSKYNLTTGMKALLYMLKYENTDNEKIYLCGFDGFKEKHFYGTKYLKSQNKSDENSYKGLSKHYGAGEQLVLKQMEKEDIIKLL